MLAGSYNVAGRRPPLGMRLHDWLHQWHDNWPKVGAGHACARTRNQLKPHARMRPRSWTFPPLGSWEVTVHARYPLHSHAWARMISDRRTPPAPRAPTSWPSACRRSSPYPPATRCWGPAGTAPTPGTLLWPPRSTATSGGGFMLLVVVCIRPPCAFMSRPFRGGKPCTLCQHTGAGQSARRAPPEPLPRPAPRGRRALGQGGAELWPHIRHRAAQHDGAAGQPGARAFRDGSRVACGAGGRCLRPPRGAGA